MGEHVYEKLEYEKLLASELETWVLPHTLLRGLVVIIAVARARVNTARPALG